MRAVPSFSPDRLSRRWDEAEAAAHLGVTLFVTYATVADERLKAKVIAAFTPPGLVTLHTTRVCAHGSVTLLDHHSSRASRETWTAEETFLDRMAP